MMMNNSPRITKLKSVSKNRQVIKRGNDQQSIIQNTKMVTLCTIANGMNGKY